MTSKTCFIEQTCGLGDILLSCKIGNYFAQLGHEVIWPVEPIYRDLSKRIHTTGFNFVCIEDDFKFKAHYLKFVGMQLSEIADVPNFIHVPLRRSFQSKAGQKLNKVDTHDAANMHGKFEMCGINYNNWQNYFELIRDSEKENKLYKELNLENKRYHLVNKNFGTPPRWKETLNKKITTVFPEIRVDMYMDLRYSVFDWLKVFENACRIDTVSTSTFYLFEKLELDCIPTIYSRNNSDRTYTENFSWIERLAKKQYLFIS